MAKPQIEDGFFMLANELADQFCRREFSKRELVVLWAVMRLTYGYKGRKLAPITARTLVELTGLDDSTIRKTVKGLVSAQVLLHLEGRLGIQTNHERWQIADRLASDPDKTSDPESDKTSEKSGQNAREDRTNHPDNSDKTSETEPGKPHKTSGFEARKYMKDNDLLGGDPHTRMRARDPQAAAIAEGLEDLAPGELERLERAFYPKGQPGGFLTLELDKRDRLFRYFKHPKADRVKAWAAADRNRSLNNPFMAVLTYLTKREDYPGIWDPEAAPPAPVRTRRGAPSAPAPTTPASPDERRARYAF